MKSANFDIFQLQIGLELRKSFSMSNIELDHFSHGEECQFFCKITKNYLRCAAKRRIL
ncbi:hypothetical protein KKE26_01155 [bacterium]|nr:hypothetical protein [bacterium]